MAATTHALLSPSHAHTWACCPASTLMEKDVPNESSPYAEEGTKAHALAEKLLRISFESYLPSTCEMQYDEKRDDVTEEMRRNVVMYTGFVKDRIDEAHKVDPEAYFAFEHSVDISGVTSEKGARGTIDCAIAYPGHLWVIDLKYGAGVPVVAERNEQLCIYAAAFLEEVELLYDVETIHLAIVQPRCGGVNQWELSTEMLAKFRANVRARAERSLVIFYGHDKPTQEGDFCCEETVCRWCRGKAKCPKLAESAAESALADYKEDEKKPAAIEVIRVPDDAEKLAKAYTFLPALESWIDMVRESVAARLGQGEAIPGFKLVAGRKGPRKWVDDAEAERIMKQARLRNDEMYSFKLISPTQFEAAIKANPKLLTKPQQQKLRDCITQSEGKPSVVSEDDKRPAIQLASKSDFEAIEDKSSSKK